MTNAHQIALPSLDEMLTSLLLVEEGEHEFAGTGAGRRTGIAAVFFPGDAAL